MGAAAPGGGHVCSCCGCRPLLPRQGSRGRPSPTADIIHFSRRPRRASSRSERCEAGPVGIGRGGLHRCSRSPLALASRLTSHPCVRACKRRLARLSWRRWSGGARRRRRRTAQPRRGCCGGPLLPSSSFFLGGCVDLVHGRAGREEARDRTLLHVAAPPLRPPEFSCPHPPTHPPN